MKNPNSKKRKKPTYLSADEKMEIVRFHYLEGGSYAQITKKYGIGHTAIGRILSNFAASNDKSALLMKKKKTDNQAEELSALKEARAERGEAAASHTHDRLAAQSADISQPCEERDPYGSQSNMGQRYNLYPYRR